MVMQGCCHHTCRTGQSTLVAPFLAHHLGFERTSFPQSRCHLRE
ncbi:hypothetical protein PspLS_06866 [Pyricularia sp. CBS 133598]|nr:hypothetical protein PspLS_06866 [Pyricularia sp. CBS 133598]